MQGGGGEVTAGGAVTMTGGYGGAMSGTISAGSAVGGEEGDSGNLCMKTGFAVGFGRNFRPNARLPPCPRADASRRPFACGLTRPATSHPTASSVPRTPFSARRRKRSPNCGAKMECASLAVWPRLRRVGLAFRQIRLPAELGSRRRRRRYSGWISRLQLRLMCLCHGVEGWSDCRAVTSSSVLYPRAR